MSSLADPSALHRHLRLSGTGPNGWLFGTEAGDPISGFTILPQLEPGASGGLHSRLWRVTRCGGSSSMAGHPAGWVGCEPSLPTGCWARGLYAGLGQAGVICLAVV